MQHQIVLMSRLNDIISYQDFSDVSRDIFTGALTKKDTESESSSTWKQHLKKTVCCVKDNEMKPHIASMFLCMYK